MAGSAESESGDLKFRQDIQCICKGWQPIDGCSECNRYMLRQTRRIALSDCKCVGIPEPAYGKPPTFTPGEMRVMLRVLTETAWLKSEDLTEFKSALKKLESYGSPR